MATQEELLRLNKEYQQRKGNKPSSKSSSKGSSKGPKEVRDLKNQVHKQNVRIAHAQGKSVKEVEGKSKPTVLGRIFDVVSRGNYAMAEGSRRGAEAQNKNKSVLNEISSFGSGFAAGLTGKKKTTFSDYLDEKGVKNKVVKGVGGLALDIVTDPMNLLGAGVTGKAAKAIDIEKAGGDAFNAAKGTKEVLEAGNRAARETALELHAKGGVKKRVITKAAAKARERTVDELAMKSAQVAKTAMEAKKGSVGLKIVGVPFVKSEKAYSALAKAGKAVGQTDTGEALKKAFSIGAHFPGETQMFKRMYENAGVAGWEDAVKTIRTDFGGLSKSQKRDISHAIERGGKVGDDLQPYVDKAKYIFDVMFKREAGEMGLMGPEKYNPDYVYHYYKGGTKETQSAFKRQRKYTAVGSETPGFTQKRQIKTLAEAKEAGFKPVEAIDDILALRLAKHQQTVARRQFVYSVTDKYGLKMTKKQADKLGLVRPVSEQKFLNDDMWFPKDIAKTLDRIDEMNVNDQVGGQFLKTFDKIQSIWKFGATAINPGHHVRNLMGDVFLNFEDGVTSAKPYYDSIKILGKKGSFRVGKKSFTGEEIYREFVDAGGKSGFFRTEFGGGSVGKRIGDANNPLEALQGFAGGITEGARNASEVRENFTRMAHFINALREEGKNVTNINELTEIARKVVHERVNKYNFDYGALTPFETNVMKRVMPFYTFARKNLPLQIEMLATKPGRIAAIPKATNAIEKLLGTDEEASDIGIVIPKWLQETAPIRLDNEEDGTNSEFWSPPLPFNQISEYTEGGKTEILSRLASQGSPLGRIFAEQAMGKQFFSGAAIDNDKQYFSNQLPLGRIGYKGLQSAQKKEGGLTRTQLINYLTGINRVKVTPQLQKSELRRQQDVNNAKIQKLIAEGKLKRKRGRS